MYLTIIEVDPIQNSRNRCPDYPGGSRRELSDSCVQTRFSTSRSNLAALWFRV